MDQDRIVPFALLPFRQRWLAFFEIRKLQEIYALDPGTQLAPRPVAVASLPGPR